jgi:hypothetical protein
MRSDRNPYFFLIKRKNPQIQQLLQDAATMTASEIDSLCIKPDVKKAMQFVHQLGHQTRSNTTAELLAEKMISACSVDTVHTTHDIYLYTGPDCEIKLNNKNWLIMRGSFLFMTQGTRMFVSHNWTSMDLGNNYIVIQHAKKVGHGDQNLYNQMNQQHLKDKYHL